ncbi:MAG: hypothetical protein ACI8PT_000613, partial [Gammaproteobacteria bacterium]
AAGQFVPGDSLDLLFDKPGVKVQAVMLTPLYFDVFLSFAPSGFPGFETGPYPGPITIKVFGQGNTLLGQSTVQEIRSDPDDPASPILVDAPNYFLEVLAPNPMDDDYVDPTRRVGIIVGAGETITRINLSAGPNIIGSGGNFAGADNVDVYFEANPPDGDMDGVPDYLDEFPGDPNETFDTDLDGTGDNADLDDDNDGASDIEEATLGTDPRVPDVRWVLGPGTNMLSLPISPQSVTTSGALLNLIGATRISRLVNGVTETTTSDGQGGFVGSFPLTPLSGYEVAITQAVDVTLTGNAIAPVVQLPIGTSWGGFMSSQSAMAHAYMQSGVLLGNISALSGLKPATERFETATVDGSGTSGGPDFAIVRGVGYAFSLLAPVTLDTGL